MACVGLQCVGFNNAMYNALLDQAAIFAQSKWKAATPVAGASATAPTTGVLGTGSVWNSTVGSVAAERDLVDALNGLNLGRLSADRIDNNVNFIASRR